MTDRYTWDKGSGPLPVLYQDSERIFFEGKKRCWDACASPMVQHHILEIVDGYAYHRGPEFDDAATERLRKHQEHILTFRARRENWYMAEIRPKVIEIIERLRKHPKITRPLPELIDHVEACMVGHADVMGDIHWRFAAAVTAGGGPPTFGWPAVYVEITGRPEAEAATLVSGGQNELTKTVRRMRRLARVAQSDPSLLAAVKAGDLAEAERASPAFRAGFKSMLRRYGHRTGSGWGSSTTSAGPTWNIRPDIPSMLIATYAKADLDEIDRKEREAGKMRRRLLREVRKSLRSDPEKLDRFEWEFEFWSKAAWVIEDHNDWMDQSAPGVLRDAVHLLGRRLVRDGVIDDPDDVLHLSLAELRSGLTDARALVAERKEEFARWETAEPPETIGAPPPEEAAPPPFFGDRGEGHVGNQLRGVAASSGKYTGVARVRMPSPLPPDVEDGEILIAKDAGPDWTPMFAVLGAVVLDVGAAWQHAAVMAREFGIPAVTGTKDGTSVIKDGQTVTVDGDAGIVELG